MPPTPPPTSPVATAPPPPAANIGPNNNIRVRHVVPHGKRVWLRIYWGNSECRGSYHNAMAHLFDTDDPDLAIAPGGDIGDYADDRWPTTCERCGAPVPPLAPLVPCPCGCGELVQPRNDVSPSRQVFRKTLYATPDRSWIGMPTVGDCYIADWYGCSEGGVCIHGWTNCDGRHLIVHVPDTRDPNGWWWDTNGRASNCTMKEDTLHRCWVVHGTPEGGDLHVDKNGLTCGAGAGSIDTGRWHGHLRRGVLEL